jgi:hypothetical protein
VKTEPERAEEHSALRGVVVLHLARDAHASGPGASQPRTGAARLASFSERHEKQAADYDH